MLVHIKAAARDNMKEAQINEWIEARSKYEID
jgi:hypothetical protein